MAIKHEEIVAYCERVMTEGRPVSLRVHHSEAEKVKVRIEAALLLYQGVTATEIARHNYPDETEDVCLVVRRITYPKYTKTPTPFCYFTEQNVTIEHKAKKTTVASGAGRLVCSCGWESPVSDDGTEGAVRHFSWSDLEDFFIDHKVQEEGKQ